jgi:hypothetical protein
MELTEKQKKDLNVFSLILNSLNMEDGVEWYYRYYGEWEDDEPNGPYYNNRNVSSELNFLPGSIGELFEEIKENFDTGNFYNEYYDNENGSLFFILNAEKKEIIVNYDYYDMITEESNIEKNFSDFSNVTAGWRGEERTVKTLTNQNVVNELIKQYSNFCKLRYDGGGDSGWIEDEIETENGITKFKKETDADADGIETNLENISYDLLELYYGGWEINEGSSGSINYNFQEQKVTMTHYQNVESTELEHYMTLKF